MPQFQHRIGAPSRPRNNDNTRWDADKRCSKLDIAFIVAVCVAVGCVWLGVTIWAPVSVGAVR